MSGFDTTAELWKLANIVTGFSVAQSLAFSFALGKDLGRLQSAPPHVKLALTAVSVLFAGLYTFAVYKCWALAEPVATTAVWRDITCGRFAAIWLFTALGVFGLFAPGLLGEVRDKRTK